MATVHAARSRRRDRSLGQIPLSSGEIELYSRQDETARRRRRLLSVRDQERRLAQQVTQRYRNNLQKLRRKKLQESQKQLSVEQRKILTELNGHYQNSPQSMETAQRSARLKLLELMKQAQKTKEKWPYNSQIAEKQWTIEAKEAREEAEAVRTARRQVEQNLERQKFVSSQQRRQANARQEQNVVWQRAKDREELEALRRMQSFEEEFVTPRPCQNDVVPYRCTRTHCLSTTTSGTERPSVKVVSQNRKQPTAMRGEDEAMKYRDEIDQKSERDRLIQKEQQEERGKKALNEVVSRRQGQQALEWLALVDRMERRARGQELGGGEDYSLNAGDVDGKMNKLERMAERAFAQMLGLDENSVELSVFSINSDDERSVAVDSGHELLDGDEAARADLGYRVKLKATQHSGTFDLRDELESGGVKSGKGEQAEQTTGKPLKTTTLGDLQCEGLEKLKNSEDMRKSNVRPDSIGVPSKACEARDSEHEDKLNMSKTRMRGGYHEASDNVPIRAPHLQWNGPTDKGDHGTATSMARHQYGYGTEERPEGNDSKEEMDPNAGRSSRSSIQESPLVEQELGTVFAAQPYLAERDQCLSSNPSADEGFYEKACYPREGHSLIVAIDEDQRSFSESSFASSEEFLFHLDPAGKDSTFKARPQDLEDESDCSAGRSAGAPAQNIESKKHSESKRSEVMAAERDGPLPSVSAFENRKESVDTEQLGNDCGVDDCVLLEKSSSQWKWRTTRGDHFTSGTIGHRDKYGNAEEQSEGMLCEVGANHFASHRSNISPQSLTRDEVDTKALRDTLDQRKGRLSTSSVNEIATEKSGSGQVSATGPVDASLVESAELLSASSCLSDAGNDRFYKNGRALDRTSTLNVAIDEDERLSLSNSFFAPSQISLSRLDQVANDRVRSLEQWFVDQHMISSSESEGLSEDGREAETELHRPSIDIDSARSSMNSSPHDLYRQQIHYQARRSSTSAVSVAQYSLPPSETQSSFDESLDRLHFGHSKDSFVNELVPMFPKHTLPPHPRSLEEDNEAFEEYDIQLVAPNISRMLASERLPSFGGSGQRLICEENQTAASDHSRRQPPASTTTQTEGKRPSTHSNQRAFSSSSSRRSYSESSSSELDAKSFDTMVEQSPVRQHAVTGQIRQATTVSVGSRSRQLPGNSQPRRGDRSERDALSDISSESGVSSLGFAAQLNIVAGTTRRRNAGDDGQEMPSSVDCQQNQHAQECLSNDEQSIATERSFASSSSISMDVNFNYLVKMTSAVGNSLPLQLQLPAMIYGKKDMIKPAAPMTWSASSMSSIASASEVDQNDDLEKSPPTARRSIPSSDLNVSDSFLEVHDVHQPRSGKVDHRVRGRDLQHSSSVTCPSEESDTSRVSGRTRETRSGKSACFTFADSKREITKLPPSSLSSRYISQPLAPMQNFGRSLDNSGSSDGQSNDDIQQHHVLRPLLNPVNTSRPAAHLQNFGHSLDDSQSSSEQHFRDRYFQGQGVRRHPTDYPYDAEKESKQDDLSSESSMSSHSDASCSSSAAGSRRQSMQKAENMVIPLKKPHSDNSRDSDGDQGGKELSLAEAFQRRHPGFGQRVDNHCDKVKRQRDKQQEQ